MANYFYSGKTNFLLEIKMNNLLTIPEFIKEARKQGASFDSGDPKIHLAYLTKLGLLPAAVKRKINGSMQGCYPESEVQTVLEVQRQKQSGSTYSQIARIQPNVPTPKIEQPLTIWNPKSSDFVLHLKPSNFAYLILGLVIGIIVSTLNTSGLAALKQNDNLSLNQSVSLSEKSGNSDVYLIAVPKTSLDKLGRTNINYLIKN